MPAPSLSELITIRDVMKSTVDSSTNSLSYNLGNIKRNETVTIGAQIWQQPGFYSIPPDPNGTTQGPQTLCLTRSDVDLVIAQRDTRYQPTGINPSEVYIYSGGNDQYIYLKNDKSITIQAPSAAINILGNNITIGDNSAQAVVYSSAFETLVNEIANIKATNPTTEPGFAALQTALSTFLVTTQYKTTKVKLT